ncbi:CotD family spore coat protein [Bacillaceae bacterium W0354]
MHHHHHHHGPHCGCPEQIVYPVNENVVHTCSESMVEHVHPSHTTHVNHHLNKNMHLYPHSDSFVNTFESVDLYGGSFEVPRPPRPTVGFGPMGPNMVEPMGPGAFGPNQFEPMEPEFGPENPNMPPFRPW